MLPGETVWAFVWSDEERRCKLVECIFVGRRDCARSIPPIQYDVLVDAQLVSVTAIYPSEWAASRGKDWT